MAMDGAGERFGLRQYRLTPSKTEATKADVCLRDDAGLSQPRNLIWGQS